MFFAVVVGAEIALGGRPDGSAMRVEAAGAAGGSGPDGVSEVIAVAPEDDPMPKADDRTSAQRIGENTFRFFMRIS